MHKPARRSFFLAGILAVILLFSLAVCPLYFWPGDLSAKKTENRLLFGATYMTLNNPYYQVLDTYLRSEIEANGDALLTRDAAMSQERQNEEITELIKAGVQAIFLTPVEWNSPAVKAGLELAADAGVPVIVVDAPVYDTDLVACSVCSDNYQVGVLCAQHLMRTRDNANIILLEHITTLSSIQRIQGFQDTLAGQPSFKILASGESDGQIENAMPVMEELLRQVPEANAVMALNDPSALGALAAIQGAGLSGRFLVYGVDGSPEAKALVSDRLMTATCAQFPYTVAREAAAQGYAAIYGGCQEKEIVVPVELLTAENVAAYGMDGWQ